MVYSSKFQNFVQNIPYSRTSSTANEQKKEKQDTIECTNTLETSTHEYDKKKEERVARPSRNYCCQLSGERHMQLKDMHVESSWR